MTIKRSPRRRSVALQVQPGQVTLYAPQRVPLKHLHDILRARQDWITHHLAAYAARPASALTFQDGSTYPFLGDTLTLTFTAGLFSPRREETRLLVRPGPPENVQLQVERWTKTTCLPTYRTLVQEYAERLHASHKLRQVTLTSARQRWGSCTSQGDIRLHWKLTRAPLHILHYVALHETAHLLELNHSPRYWAHVTRLMPDWPQHRQWLKESGSSL